MKKKPESKNKIFFKDNYPITDIRTVLLQIAPGDLYIVAFILSNLKIKKVMLIRTGESFRYYGLAFHNMLC